MSRQKRIIAPKAKQGPQIKASEPADYNNRPPVFSFEKLQSGDYCLSVLDQECKAQFAEAMFRRKDMTWNDIKNAGRHGLGSEKIPLSQLRVGVPTFITEEMDHVLALRYNGKRPMLGYRQRDVFFVLWFDHNFTIYPHA